MVLHLFFDEKYKQKESCKMIIMNRHIILSILLAFPFMVASCGDVAVNAASSDEVAIYPDYKDVTIPFNIAPLNFMTDDIRKGKVLFDAGDGCRLVVGLKRGHVHIPEGKWRRLLDGAKGKSLTVTITDAAGKAYSPFTIMVSEDPVDRYVAYRLIAPGYKLWGKMGIYQRDLESFRQTAVIENDDIDNACVNCHSFAERDPETMLLHVRRTDYGGTYVDIDGRIERLDTKTPQTVSALVYPSWHPDRGYVAFSVNSTMQTFHVSDPDKVEVYDSESDVVVYDVKRRKLLTTRDLFGKNAFETFPSFSNDGNKLYFCSADSLEMPARYKELKYSLCSIEFDAETGSFGQTDTLVKAGAESVTMPKLSPDGRWLLFTSTEYGNFTVWHKDADLVLYDLARHTRIPAYDWNSSHDAESWHSWSGNSRWVVFSSRRDDGNYTRLYLGHISADGTLGKAFLLPQKDPARNERLMYSYNIPEFVTGKIRKKGFAVRNAEEPHKIEFAEGYVPPMPDAVSGASMSLVN